VIWHIGVNGIWILKLSVSRLGFGFDFVVKLLGRICISKTEIRSFLVLCYQNKNN